MQTFSRTAGDTSAGGAVRRVRQGLLPLPGGVHRIALAGNTAALTLLVFAASLSGFLFGAAPGEDVHSPGAGPIRPQERRAVLVVIDGLRADTAFDAEAMPNLSVLSAESGRGIALVESVVPSSVAAIETFVTGRVPPPASFLSDFGAGERSFGGVFEAVAEAGGSVFVAGPTLWTDLYGRWVAETEKDPTFGLSDANLLRAALPALESQEHELVVIHFLQVDAAAHRYGATSAEYRTAAAWCDRAIGRIVEAAGREAAIVVTSDHGNRYAGGHAGPEPAVLETPLIVRREGLGPGELGAVPQSAVWWLLHDALGLERPVIAVEDDARTGSPRWVLALVALATGVAVCSSVGGSSNGLKRAFVLNAAVWSTLALLLSGFAGASLWVGACTLAGVALAGTMRPSAVLVGLVAAGGVVGGVRLVDGFWSLRWAMIDLEITALPELVRLGMMLVAAVAWGKLTAVVLSRGAARRWRRGEVPVGIAVAGAFAAGGCAIVSRVGAETVSLSTVDVSEAYRAVELPFGVAAAVLVVTAMQALPAAGIVAGFARALAGASPEAVGAFAAGAAALFAGQAAVAAGEMAFASGDVTLAALSLGLYLRSLGEAVFLFLGMAAAVAFAREPGTAPVQVARP